MNYARKGRGDYTPTLPSSDANSMNNPLSGPPRSSEKQTFPEYGANSRAPYRTSAR